MSFFSDIFDSIGDFFGDNSSSIIEGAASIGGALLSTRANERAAEEARRASEAEAAAIRQASADADRRLELQQRIGEAGVRHLQQLSASDPSQLTPAQQRGREESQRNANATLAASGLRGAGRTVTAALNDVDDNYLSRAIETNIGRRDSAASQLAGESFAAGRDAINIGTQGAVTAAGVRADGARSAIGADLANASLRGQALGDVAAIIADETKTRGRESRYDKDRYAEEPRV